jgi:TPR repeat protein
LRWLLIAHTVDLRNLLPSCPDVSRTLKRTSSTSVAQRNEGLVHLQLAKFFETGRLSDNQDTADLRAAFFHYQQAAALDCFSALMGLARVYSGLPRSILADLDMTDPASFYRCIKHATTLYEHPYTAYLLACMYDEGRGVHVSKAHALQWFSKVSDFLYSEKPIPVAVGVESEVDFHSFDQVLEKHTILHRMAQIYELGGEDFAADLQTAVEYYRDAAEAAMEAQKVLRANR